MKELWTIYHKDIPQFIRELIETKEMKRIDQVGMNCGCEYTNLKTFTTKYYYSRLEHSIGVALIIWHFTKDKKQAISGLFHDIATPVFAHAIDFLNNDYLLQQSTEDYTEDIIKNSKEIMTILQKYQITLEEIKDYHIYPIADNDSPQLSADRLEYTLGNLYNYGYCTLQEIKEYYNDLIVDKNEEGILEIQFKTKEIAYSFIKKAFLTFEIYVADSDRFSMQCIADIVKECMALDILKKDDLYSIEPEVLAKIKNHEESLKKWNQYCQYQEIIIHKEKPKTGYFINIDAKRRYIDPYVENQRLSTYYQDISNQIEEFINRDFYYWIGAK